LSLFEELKRRKVVRVAVVYAATAFAVLQAADIMLPQMNVPDWAMGLLVAFVVFGFPIALVLAWALEVTPDGIKRTEDAPAETSDATPALLGKRTVFAAALLVVLGVGIGAGWFLRPAAESPSGSAPAASLAPAAAENAAPPAFSLGPVAKSIAVLPFVNMSADAENEYFADGISEELLNVLVKVEDIGVASRTSSFAFKGRELGAAVIARELNVNHILEGSVRKSGNRVRITAQLIDALEDRHLWSETYDRELTDIFAIQDEIANAIVAALRGTLGAGEAQRAVTVRADTDNMDAYQRYLKARELFLARTALDESVRLFEEVVAMDPEFARGWEGLAAVNGIIIDWTDSYPGIDTVQLTARAFEAADRALALDPQLSMPWAVRGLLMNYELPIPFAESLVLFERAIIADPAQASVYLWRAITWVNLGFLDLAMNDLDACLAVDPAYGNCVRWKAVTAALMGDDALAMALFERGVATGFVVNRADTFIERLVARGDRLTALLLMREREMPPELQQAMIAAIEQDAPPAQLAALLERHPRFDIPVWHIVLRAYDRAAAWEGRGSTLVSYWDPVHAGFRNSPAFRSILERLGIPAYWREHGYPPLCWPLGADDYECAQ
jgi:TolB-like protein